jgi:hypothetical protein
MAPSGQPARFSPQPGQTIRIGSSSYRFDRDEAVTAFPIVFKDGSGRRSEVYRLEKSGGGRFALKVFKERFREPDLQSTVQRMAPLRGLPGFRAAQRSVLLAGEPAVQQYPELLYAMLMPWIAGTSWGAILARAGARELYLRPGAALHLACQFLGVMEGLERIPATHTDVASGNVTLEAGDLSIEMLDLEDLFVAGVKDCGNRGTDGYVHPMGPMLSCPEGDRYATAVLAAEMVILAHPALAAEAAEDGYFKGNRALEPGPDRFRAAEPWLTSMAPEFAHCFRQAWYSSRLEGCPEIRVLRGEMAKARRRFPRGSGSLVIPLAGPNGGARSPRLVWAPPGSAPRDARPRPPSPAPAAASSPGGAKEAGSAKAASARGAGSSQGAGSAKEAGPSKGAGSARGAGSSSSFPFLSSSSSSWSSSPGGKFLRTHDAAVKAAVMGAAFWCLTLLAVVLVLLLVLHC